MRRQFLIASFLALPFICQPTVAPYAQTPATQGQPAQSAATFVQNMAATALNSIAGKPLSAEETTQRFRTILRENFDLKTIGRFALGNYYNSASPAQREEYQQVFENMIVDAYAIRFRDYSGGSFKTGRETQQGAHDSLVESQIGQSNGAPPIGVTWRVRNEDNAFKVIDVSVEGVSMSQTERSEFAAFIDQHGGQVQTLIDAIKNRQIGLKNNDQ